MVPASVTPPDVPAVTRFHEVIERGALDESVPISVDHVSAVDDAIAPAAATFHRGFGWIMAITAHAANAEPFASTCHMSRSPLFSTTSAVRASFAACPNLERAVELTKNAMRIHAQLHPAHVAAVAVTIAAGTPLGDRARFLCAMSAMIAESTRPAASLVAEESGMPIRSSPARRLQ